MATKYTQRNGINRKARQAYVVEVKTAAACMDCGVDDLPPYCYDFDHRDPDTKRSKVSRQVSGGTMNSLKAEIEKCDIVCSNCHRKRTFGSGAT